MPEGQDILEEVARSVTERAKERIDDEAKRAVETLKAQIESLRRSARVALPMDVLKIIREGGAVASQDFDFTNSHGECRVDVSIGSTGLPYDLRPSLKTPGKFRLTLIVERLADKET